MKKLRAIFYYLTTGVAIGVLCCLLLLFNVNFEMMVSQQLVMFIFTAFGLILGIAYTNINRYVFFALEAAIFLIALIGGKTQSLIYIVKEFIMYHGPVKNILVPTIAVIVIVNLINLYIVLTQKKYQKYYSREERKAMREEEVKLSDLREEKTPEEIAELKHKRKIQRIIALIILGVLLGLYFFVPSIKAKTNEAFSTISKLDTDVVVAYLRSYGKQAAVVSFVLMILQSIAAPIPAFLITLSNAAIFGWVKGAMLSWSSAMAGAALCFFLARALGRDAVERLTSKGAMESVDVFFERYGKYAILICRLLPFVSFDFVSYGAGLTNMGFWSFFIATGIGQLPATIVYSYVGGTLTGGAQKLFLGLLTLFALSIMIGIAKKVYNDKQKKKGGKVVE
ncbi:TVP38/TMEM64 family protein [Finegoldia magna]|uniref:TVP38/TMEM64 family protein n=1 Tax=Finegoldia magna TaxID=1260 RepID=UPI000D9FA56C|nr:TVP38/TMEM64 family protein [Finegoldia magna]MCC3310389.1 TVP38/TMEM64 family protein [Finegoldia magna]PWV50370.1 putative membrane protein YdjX (TVP38/TMEM64 family) [Finegoldia magna]